MKLHDDNHNSSLGIPCLWFTCFLTITIKKIKNMKSLKLKQLAALAALTALPCVASAAITIGATASNRDGDSLGATNTISSFEVVAGSNHKLVLTLASETAASVTGITFGGQSFIKAVDTGTTRMAQIWYLDDATVGTADIVATFDANARSAMAVVSLTGAAAGGPSAFAADTVLIDVDTTKASFDFTTTEANTFVIGNYTQHNGGGQPINPSSMTDLFLSDSGSSNAAMGYQIQTIAGQSTYTWEAPEGFEINTSNGVVMASFSAIPEPGTYALLAGLAGLSAVMLRRR